MLLARVARKLFFVKDFEKWKNWTQYEYESL